MKDANFSVQVTVPVNSAHAWEFLFNQIDAWFDKEYHTSPQTKRFVFETYLGGRVYEDFGEGDGLIWANVIGCDYLHTIDMRGYLARRFGGPATTLERFVFENVDAGCQVTYEMDLLGDVNDKTVAQLKEGWEDILQKKYKTYCEQRKNK